MIIILRIFSAFAYLSAVAVLVLGVFDFIRESPQIEQILQQPSIIERFEDTSDHQDNPVEESSPLVVQARAYASYLNPPPPSEEREKKIFASEHTPLQSAPVITKPPPPPAPSAKFKVLGTSYYPNQPERSMALIWQPGSQDGYEKWVKEGSRLGHFVVHKIKRGVVIYQDNQQRTYEMAIEKQNTTNSLVKEHIPGLTIAQGKISHLSTPSGETDSNAVSK